MPLLLLTLLGCPWIDDDLAADRFDVDGDGFPWPDDCEEGNADAFPGAPEWCNDLDDDCDGSVDEPPVEDGTTWYRDDDGDGWGIEADPMIACSAPEATAAVAGDCDDASADAHPGLPEVCNDRRDNDCDGTGNDCKLLGEHSLVEADHVGAGGTVAFAHQISPVDLDGDGDRDLAVGAPAAQIGGEVHGAVYIFDSPLPADFVPADADVVFWGLDIDELAGWRVSGLGDVDEDGREDLLVSSPTAANAGVYEGRIYLVRGGDWSGDVSLGAVEAGFGGSSGYWGYATAGPGDATGDGVADAWVGTPLAESLAGGAYLLAGPITGLTPADAVGQVMGSASEMAGFAVGAAGDVDGDGTADLLIGSPNASGAGEGSGAAWLVGGGLHGTAATVDSAATLLGGEAYDAVGMAVEGTGDNDGDGLADWAAIAPGVSDGDRTGVALLVRSPVEGVFGPDATVARVLGAAGSAQPTVVTCAGDLDGDGRDDIALGLPHAGEGGMVVVFYGPLEGVLTAEQGDAVLLGEAGHPYAGTAVVGLGDIDGDSYDDLGVGASASYDDGVESAVYIYGGIGL